jgi:dienelactone hydrolase
VHVPDLYDGAVFDGYAEGLRHLETLGGIPALVARSEAAVAHLPPDVVYAGFSNGAASAELLAATRPGARGAILMHGALPTAAFGVAEWPATVPVQVHVMRGDPFREPAHLEAFAADVRRAGATLEHYDYPGAGHLFADPDLPEYDPAAAALLLTRVLDGLSRMTRRGARA